MENCKTHIIKLNFEDMAPAKASGRTVAFEFVYDFSYSVFHHRKSNPRSFPRRLWNTMYGAKKSPESSMCVQVIVQVKAKLRHIVLQMFHLCVQAVFAKSS